jgi:hypothetical protein
MMKAFGIFFLAALIAIELAHPAQAAESSYMTVRGSNNGTIKGGSTQDARPTPTPVATPNGKPVAKPSPGTHKEAPTPTPVPLTSIKVLKLPVKKP